MSETTGKWGRDDPAVLILICAYLTSEVTKDFSLGQER